MPSDAVSGTPRAVWGGAVLGFALGGFFDGILLHQVLQWHHLFSLLAGERWRDLRNQILMDGWFHVLHYLIACVGLYLLWTGRAALTHSGTKLLGAAALGFSVWQFVDVVGFHFLVGIHRTRIDAPSPLIYDLGWLAAFGVTSLVLGIWLWNRQQDRSGRGPAAALAVLALLAGPAAAVPVPGGPIVVLFAAGSDAAANMSAAAAIGPIVWVSSDGDALAVVADRVATLQLYAHGAVLVGSTPILGVCLAR